MNDNGDTTYMVYGLSVDMQNLITVSSNKLKSSPMKEVFESIDKSPLSQDEKDIVIFEMGRKFERSRHVRG